METTRPVPITVTFSQELTPRTRRITFDGPIVVESTKPASYLSLFFSEPGDEWPAPVDSPKLDKRTYTPRYIDANAGAMTIDFALHGEGRASQWALSARRGDVVWAGTVTGGYALPDEISHLVLAGDDTAIPAIGTILEALPAHTRTTVIIEIVDEDDERDPSESVSCDPIWLHRGTDVTNVGDQMLNLVKSISVPPSACWWLAGEREAIRSVRDLLVTARSVPHDRISVAAYWRIVPLDPRMRKT